jgi:hypothetical protein
MIELYSNDNLKIITTKENENLFKIEFNYAAPLLIHSLIKTKIIRGATCSYDYKMFMFKAYSVEMFDNFKHRNIYSAAKMIQSLTTQLKYLIDTECCAFLGYNTKNLVVIDENKFVFLDCDMIKEINENKIMITSPINKRAFFFSPELESIINLPTNVHYKTSYFSLCYLLLYTLLTEESATSLYKEYLLKDFDYNILNKYLNTTPFKNTKLTFLISRCLVKEPEKRSILFI